MRVALVAHGLPPHQRGGVEAHTAALARELARASERSEVVVVAGAGHAFMNDTRPDAYRPEAAADAWRRTVAFLRDRLS